MGGLTGPSNKVDGDDMTLSLNAEERKRRAQLPLKKTLGVCGCVGV